MLYASDSVLAAMEPGERHREHERATDNPAGFRGAAMEPGERHREHKAQHQIEATPIPWPQWSPVNVTGNTSPLRCRSGGTSPRRNGAR